MEEACGQSNQYNHAVMILSQMNKFYAGEMYWDVQLQVDTRLFKCQRSLLGANSEYFHTMFYSNFIESNAKRDEPIKLNEMDPTAFEELLNFMHTGDIRVHDSNVLPLLFMNDFLRLKSSHVKKQCLKHVKSRSQKKEPMSNALELLSFVFMKEESAFVDTLSDHVCSHLYHFSKDEKLMKFSFENLNALLAFSKDLILPLSGCADILVKIIYDWTYYNREERSQYRCKLMKNVNVASVSSDFALSLANTLANALDEGNKDTKFLEIGVGLGGNARLSATTSFKVKNFKDVQIGVELYSSSSIISNLSWKTNIARDGNYIRVRLYCDGTDLVSEWYCYAIAIFTIKSHKEGGEDFTRKLNNFYLFSSKKFYWGYSQFLKWNELVDPEKGYVDADGSITIETEVFADVPFRKMI